MVIMKKKLLIFGAILFCAMIFIAVQVLFFKTASPDRAVLKFSKELNKTCPTMVDAETRLDKVDALADNSLRFNYTLINRDKDSLAISNLKKFMEPVILNKIKTSPALSRYLNKNLTWIYSYNDKNGDFIFKITYTPEQFK
jgi:hypothetical protein